MADMSANSDGAVDALATYVRASFAAPLARIQATGSATATARAAYAAGADDATLDALVPALRTAHLTNSTSTSTSTPLLPDTAAWKRVLLTVFRRFTGRMVVRGKLLNQGELLVSHFCRVDAAISGRPRDFCVRIPESLSSSVRIILPCEDGPAEQVGRDDVIARVKPASYPASADAEVVVSVCSASDDYLEHNANSPVITPSMWEDARALMDLDMLYGFDVRFLLQSHNGIVARMADENEDSANAVIARAPAFSDLRCTQLMMRNYGILQSDNSSSSSARRFESFATETSGASTAMEEHPRSYISLGKAQKKRWADERLASGQELAGKGRMKDALAELSSCLTLEEEHVGAFFARAEAFASLQHFPNAIRDLEMVRRLDPAFPGLDEALARARSKLKHSRHAEIPSSLVDLRGTSIAAPGSHSFKSRSRLKAHSDGYSKDATTKCRKEEAANTKNPSQDDDSKLVRRSQSASSSLSKPRAAAATSDQHQSKKKELESDRLRRLLEEEVGGEKDRKEKRHRRKKSSRARYSSDDGEGDSSDDSSDDGSIRKKRKSSSSSKKKKKKRKHDEKREQSSRKSTKKKHRRRHRSSDDSSSDSSNDSDSSSGSDRSRKRNRKQKKKHSRHSSRRDRSASRGHGGENSNDASTKEAEPHPILARQRHRIWN